MTDSYQQLRDQILEQFKALDTSKYALVQTSRNLNAIVDKKHYQRLKQYRWYAVASRGGYVSVAGDVDGSRISLQRLVLSYETGSHFKEIRQVTFANKLVFDCRAENLVRRVGRTSVMRNRRGKSGSSSKYKGVRNRDLKTGSSWSATIKGDTGRIELGRYKTEVEAAKVYDAAAMILFGESAFINLPEMMTDAEARIRAHDRIQRNKNIRARRAKATSG